MLMRLAVLLALVLGIGAAEAQEKKKVVITQASEGFLYVPIYVARAKNYFAAEGLEVEIIVAKGGAAALTAVLGGNADVYAGLPATAIEARQKGQKVKVFGAVMTQYASNVVLQAEVAKKAGLTESSPTADRLKALKGLRIGITGPGSATDQLMRYFARTAGLDPDRDLTIVPIGAAGPMLAAFAQKRIDAFSLSSPTSDTAVVKNGAFMLLDLTRGGYEPLRDFLYITLIARDEWLDKNPETATRLVRGLAKAEKLMRERPEEARNALRTFFEKTDEAVFDAALKNNLPAYPASPRIDPAAIERNLDFSEATEGKRPQLSVEELYTNKFVDAAER